MLPAIIFRQLCLQNCKQKMTGYLDENVFENYIL